MEQSRVPIGPCAITGCHAAGHTWVVKQPGNIPEYVALCRQHLAQMLHETGLIAKPEYRALLDEAPSEADS